MLRRAGYAEWANKYKVCAEHKRELGSFEMLWLKHLEFWITTGFTFCSLRRTFVQNALLLVKQEVFQLLYLLGRAFTLGLSFGVSGDAVMWLALPASDLTEINERCVLIDSPAPLKRHRSTSSQQPAKTPLFTVEAMDQSRQTSFTAQRWTLCFIISHIGQVESKHVYLTFTFKTLRQILL